MKFSVLAVLAIVATAESQRCVPNTIFPEYCNTCWCSSDGSYAKCTDVVCESGAWNKDGTLKPLYPEKPEQVCKPGTTFKDYCNTCTCSLNGTSKACTLMYCDERIWNKDGTLKSRNNVPVETGNSNLYCKPYERFEQYCDHCKCSSDGKSAVCTIIYGCDPNIWNDDGSLKFGLRHGQRCRPYSPFLDRCNDCSCNWDGIVASCDKMGCPESWTRYGRFPVHVWNPVPVWKPVPVWNPVPV